VQFEAYAFAYHTGLSKEMNIPRAPNAPIRGTVVINISGHSSGGLNDRVTGWAEREFNKLGARVGDSVKLFQELKQASDTAARALQSDRTKTSVDIAFQGKTVSLPRATFDKMQQARLDSDNEELSLLAHYGNDALRKQFASTNSYQVRIQTQDGKSETMTFQRNNPDKIEFATRIPVEIPGTEGQVVLEAWPNGSAGVAGYSEARRYKIHVGKDLFDLAKAEAAAKAYQAKHPEVRWDTEFESDDLDAKHVSPSPRPYQDF
jgi:hypothetical protein